jgi:hypothetical protein
VNEKRMKWYNFFLCYESRGVYSNLRNLGRECIFFPKMVDFDGWAGSGSAGVVIHK